VLRPGTESKRSVLRLSKPTSQQVESFLIAQRTEEFSYSEQGASRQQAPAGFTVDHNRIQLGEGVEDFNRAKRAIDAWKMFDLTWVNLSPSQGPIHRGANVAVVISHLGFWSMNAARIVYVIDERGSSQTYGFAYGNPDSTTTLVGASGAIAGVLGAYLVMFPRARVMSLVPIAIVFIPIRLPAWVVLGSWFLLQWLYSSGSGVASGAGVAYLAHVYGFVAGALLALLLRPMLGDRGPVPVRRRY